MKIKLKIKSASAPQAAPASLTIAQANSVAPLGVEFGNRESWLHAAAQLLEHVFAGAGVTLPAVHVSTGFGFARSGSSAKIGGQCWDKRASTDNKAHVFVSPVIEDAETAIATLAHELIHAAIGTDKGHGPMFRGIAHAIGLTGPMRSTVAGVQMISTAASIVQRIGAYPHAKINIADRESAGVPKQATRMLKFVCAKSGYVCRTTAKWVSLYGAPVSPVTQLAMVAA